MKFIDTVALAHFLQGHSFKTDDVAMAIDECLVRWDGRNGEPSAMLQEIAHNPGKPLSSSLPADRPRTLLFVDQVTDGQRNVVQTRVAESDVGAGLAPMIIFGLHSRTLDVPMRVELPLRAVQLGTPTPQGKHVIYLHLLRDSAGDEWKYYGMTRRGWNERFMEHIHRRKLTDGKRLMTQKVSELTQGRIAELKGQQPSTPALRSVASVICAFGLSSAQADQVEEDFIDRHSLHEKHSYGLNVLPGGKKGRRIAMTWSKQRRK